MCSFEIYVFANKFVLLVAQLIYIFCVHLIVQQETKLILCIN